MAARLKQISASGKVADGPLWLKGIVLTAGSDAATLAVDDSTDGSGTDQLTLKAATGASAVWTTGDRDGVFIKTALYGTLTGTGPVASFEFEQG